MARSPSIASDVGFTSVRFLLKAVATPAALVWVARELGPVGQGQFGFVYWAVGVTAQITTWGLAVGVTRFVAGRIGAGSPAAALSAARASARTLALSSVLFLLLAWPAVEIWGGALRSALLVGIPATLAAVWKAWGNGLAFGLRRYDFALRADLLHFSVLFSCLYWGLRAEDPVAGAVAAYALARGLEALWLGRRASRELRRLAGGHPAPTADAGRDLSRSLHRYAASMAGVILFEAVLWERSEVLFLRIFASWEELGFYTAAFALAVLPSRVPNVLGVVLLPAIAQIEGEKGAGAEVGAALRRGARLLTVVLAGPIAVGIGAAPAVIAVLYGPDFAPAAPVMQLLLFPMLFVGAGTAGSKTLSAAGGHGLLLRAAGGMAAVNLLADLLLIPRGAALGAALACGGAQSAAVLLQAWLAFRRYPTDAAQPDGRWAAQAAVALGAGLMTAVAGLVPLPGGAVPTLVLQLSAGVGTWGLLASRIRPLPAVDVRMIRAELPEPVARRFGPVLERLAG